MKLYVTDTRDHQQNLARQHPDDKCVVVNDRLSGIRVTEIVDETWKRRTERTDQWWEYAMCRVEA